MKQTKIIGRFLSIPKDFTWDELVKVLSSYGYTEMKNTKTGGSRRKFVDNDKNILSLHKPHPSAIVKSYAIKQVIETLQERGQIKDE